MITLLSAPIIVLSRVLNPANQSINVAVGGLKQWLLMSVVATVNNNAGAVPSGLEIEINAMGTLVMVACVPAGITNGVSGSIGAGIFGQSGQAPALDFAAGGLPLVPIRGDGTVSVSANETGAAAVIVDVALVIADLSMLEPAAATTKGTP